MFEKGKIDIALPKTNFDLGDTISGNVALTMKKPIKARELSISLIGDQTTTEGGGVVGGTKSTNKARIYDFKQQLDVEKEYDKVGAYHFEIKIPADIPSRQPQMPQIEGMLGEALKVAQVFMGTTKTTTKWYLLAKLDIPWGIDIKKEVQITIG
jgi:hypothetical protein